MSGQTVAGVDWAGGEWLVVTMDEEGLAFQVEPDIESVWDSSREFDRILIDVPIGLPDDEETLAKREELDSLARSVTGRSSSVFPVPSRAACQEAMAGKEYDAVVEANEADLDKGLNMQSYYIAAAIGEVDAFLIDDDAATETILEAHPEVCFRGFLERQLSHSKKSAQGVGERLEALQKPLDSPGETLRECCQELTDESADITVDDVIDALGLCAVAQYPEAELRSLPQGNYSDAEGIPMQMLYWSEESLV